MKTLPSNEFITLCGSTKFKKEFQAINRILTARGNIVYSVAFFGHADSHDLSDIDKHLLDNVHMHKIENSHNIFVINVDGYIGESTSNEIFHAQKLKKYVYYLSEYPDLIKQIGK